MTAKKKKSWLQRLLYDLARCMPQHPKLTGFEDRRRSDKIRGWTFLFTAALLTLGSMAKCTTAVAEAFVTYDKETHK